MVQGYCHLLREVRSSPLLQPMSLAGYRSSLSQVRFVFRRLLLLFDIPHVKKTSVCIEQIHNWYIYLYKKTTLLNYANYKEMFHNIIVVTYFTTICFLMISTCIVYCKTINIQSKQLERCFVFIFSVTFSHDCYMTRRLNGI